MNWRFLAPLALLVAAPALADTSKIETIQRNVGEPDADGFVQAGSKKGGFTLDLPCRYSEIEINDTAKSSKPIAVHGDMLMCVDNTEQRAVLVMAMASRYNTGGQGADHYFDAQAATYAKEGELTLFNHPAGRAFRARVKNDEGCKWVLSVRTGERLLSIVYFVQTKDCDKFQATADRIFASLKVDGK